MAATNLDRAKWALDSAEKTPGIPSQAELLKGILYALISLAESAERQTIPDPHSASKPDRGTMW